MKSADINQKSADLTWYKLEYFNQDKTVDYSYFVGTLAVKNIFICFFSANIMAIQVVEFSKGGYKIRKILPKNQYTQRKFLNFENWTKGEPQ